MYMQIILPLVFDNFPLLQMRLVSLPATGDLLFRIHLILSSNYAEDKYHLCLSIACLNNFNINNIERR